MYAVFSNKNDEKVLIRFCSRFNEATYFKVFVQKHLMESFCLHRPSPGGDLCRNVGGCDCAQRVKRAELRLLGLQYIMCQQHCWRRYFTSPLGEGAPQG